MTNRNKSESRIDGKRFIRQALGLEAQVLAKKLEQSVHSITHNGVMGEVNEQHLLRFCDAICPGAMASAGRS